MDGVAIKKNLLLDLHLGRSLNEILILLCYNLHKLCARSSDMMLQGSRATNQSPRLCLQVETSMVKLVNFHLGMGISY